MLMNTDILGYKALPMGQEMEDSGDYTIGTFLDTRHPNHDIPLFSPLSELIDYLHGLSHSPGDVKIGNVAPDTISQLGLAGVEGPEAHISRDTYKQGVADLRKMVEEFKERSESPWLTDAPTKSYLLMKSKAIVEEYWDSIHGGGESSYAEKLPDGVRVAIGMAESKEDLGKAAELLLKNPKFVSIIPISKEYMDKVGDRIKAAQEEAQVYHNIYNTVLDAAVNIADKMRIIIDRPSKHGPGG